MPGEILELAESDLASTLEGDFGREITISFLSGDLSVFGQVLRVSAITDPQTNVQVNLPRLSCTVRISSLNGNEIKSGLKVLTSDITGASIEGKIIDPRPDFTLGIITFGISRKEANQTVVSKGYSNA